MGPSLGPDGPPPGGSADTAISSSAAGGREKYRSLITYSSCCSLGSLVRLKLVAFVGGIATLLPPPPPPFPLLPPPPRISSSFFVMTSAPGPLGPGPKSGTLLLLPPTPAVTRLD